MAEQWKVPAGNECMEWAQSMRSIPGHDLCERYTFAKYKNSNRIIYRTRAIITRGLYTFYPHFEVHLCTVTIGLMYG